MAELGACPACGAGLTDGDVIIGCDRLHRTPGRCSVVRCRHCGSGATLPLVSEPDLAAFYPASYNAYSLPGAPVLRLLATRLYVSRYRRGLMRHPLSELAQRRPGRLLDVGGGRGDLGVMLAPRGWYSMVLDPSPEACRSALERGVDARVGSLTSAADDLGTGWDAVVFQHSLEHVVDPFAALHAAHQLLAPGGLLVVTLPNFGSWQARRFGSYWFHLDVPRHRTHFTRTGLEQLAARTGFQGIRTSTSTSADGLPMSVEYRLLGSRVLRPRARLIAAAVALISTPVSLVSSRLAGEGDILHATASRPTTSTTGDA